jgi:hypothetical protein
MESTFLSETQAATCKTRRHSRNTAVCESVTLRCLSWEKSGKWKPTEVLVQMFGVGDDVTQILISHESVVYYTANKHDCMRW